MSSGPLYYWMRLIWCAKKLPFDTAGWLSKNYTPSTNKHFSHNFKLRIGQLFQCSIQTGTSRQESIPWNLPANIRPGGHETAVDSEPSWSWKCVWAYRCVQSLISCLFTRSHSGWSSYLLICDKNLSSSCKLTLQVIMLSLT